MALEDVHHVHHATHGALADLLLGDGCDAGSDDICLHTCLLALAPI